VRLTAKKERASPLFYFCGCGLLVGLLLGGGRGNAYPGAVAMQIVSVPVLLAALWRLMDTRLTPKARSALWLCGAFLLVPLAQLVPLPPAVWTKLPLREHAVATLEAIGQAASWTPTWAPISLAPEKTWLGLLSMVPPLSVFLAALTLNGLERRRLTLLCLGAGLVNLFVGLAQLAQGPSSPLRFYQFTSAHDVVGLFANRTQLATFFYSLLLFAAAWMAGAAIRLTAATPAAPPGSARSKSKAASSKTRQAASRFDAAEITTLMLAGTVLVVLMVGVIMAASRAGLVLAFVALAAAFALPKGVAPPATPRPALRWAVLGAMGLVLLFFAQYGLSRLLARFEADPLADARFVIARVTTDAALAAMPFGSGFGTFVPVYALFETPRDMLNDAYVNHAHNEFLEFWLESGVAGVAVMLAFLAWFVLRCFDVWRLRVAEGGETDLFLARAASLVVALLLAHSLVDFPLRFGAHAALFAFCCALLIAPQTAQRLRAGGPAHRGAAAPDRARVSRPATAA